MEDSTASSLQEMAIEEIRSRLTTLRNRQKELELIAQQEKGKLFDTKADTIKAKNELKEVEAEIKESDDELFKRKTFKKATFIENFKALTSKTGVKIGQIETEALVAPGYLSRIDKDGNTSDPSIEFIATAARLFDVKVDDLLYGKVEERSETEDFLIEFLSYVLDDTSSDNIIWDVVKNVEGESYTDDSVGDFEHGLFRLGPGDDVILEYDSKFEAECHLSEEHNSYSADIPKSGSKLYVMVCFDHATQSDFYELYMEDRDEINPVCTSKVVCAELQRRIVMLYKEICKSGNRVHLSGSVQNAINDYMMYKRPLPFK